MIGIIVQARTGSTRFPRKIYQDINGKYTLQRVLEGCFSAQVPHKIILAMPDYDEREFRNRFDSGEFDGIADDRLETYFGSSDDVLDRYFQPARKYGLTTIIRVTADCPLIQGDVIDEMAIYHLKSFAGGNCFTGNNALVSPSPYPDGTDVEIFPYWMLTESHLLAQSPSQREHVTPYMYRRDTQYALNPFYNCRPNKMISTKIPDFSFDTDEDYKLLLHLTAEYDKHGDLNKAIGEIKP